VSIRSTINKDSFEYLTFTVPCYDLKTILPKFMIYKLLHFEVCIT